MIIPYVIEKTADGERSFDLFSRLLEDRIVRLCGEVTDESANIIKAEIAFLDNKDSSKPILFYIDSPGGSCTAGLGIIDTMDAAKAPVYTICDGFAASMGAAILSSGDKRFATKNASIMFHQASGRNEGNVQDQRVSFKEMERINNVLINIIIENCGLKKEEYEKLTIRDCWLSSEQALNEFGAYGAIDEIIQPTKKKIRIKKQKNKEKK